MNHCADRRGVLWALLGLWVGTELLFSSRWWPPAVNPLIKVASLPARRDSLRALLSNRSASSVWFAPYTTFPETGFVESVMRRGVYDTLLNIPARGEFRTNYGASKLTPADTLFALASLGGLHSELRLAQRLGYRYFALDLGALVDGESARVLCLATFRCRLSGDGYALFPIGGDSALGRGLAAIERRQPLLPVQSAGPSWGALVFNPFQWRAVGFEADKGASGVRRFVVRAQGWTVHEIYRYPLDRFPVAVRRGLRLESDDVVLELAPDVVSARFCLRSVDDSACKLVELGPHRRTQAISTLIPPGQITRLELMALQSSGLGQSPFSIAIRTPSPIP